MEVGLKWPNDLFAGDRKLAGVLAESSVRGGAVDALVIGIGMNVNWPAELPEDLGELAVALNHLAGHDVDRVALAASLVRTTALAPVSSTMPIRVPLTSVAT